MESNTPCHICIRIPSSPAKGISIFVPELINQQDDNIRFPRQSANVRNGKVLTTYWLDIRGRYLLL